MPANPQSQLKTALVTGSNRGLGLGTCRALARLGFHVLLTSRKVDEGKAAAQRLVAEGLRAEHQALDVTSAASVSALADALRERGLRLDVLVNNAGVSLSGFNAEVARRTLEANYYGPLRVTDAFSPLIRDGGNVVMVSSGMGELSGFGPKLREALLDPALDRRALAELMQAFVADVEHGRHRLAGWPTSAYSVSKAALNALTRVIAKELAPRGIRVNAVCPGWVRTDMGGRGAPRTLDQGVASIVWGAVLEQPTSGGFFRDGRAIEW